MGNLGEARAAVIQGDVRGTGAVFLDRDGTITRDTGYTHRIEDLQLLEHAVDGLQLLAALGWPLILVTNQAGIGRGLFDEAAMDRFHAALRDRLGEAGVRFAGIYFCPNHPTKGIGAYRQESLWRKPAPGMLLAAAQDHRLDLAASYMIGDKTADIEAGAAAGCTTILVRTGYGGADNRSSPVTPHYIADDLLKAAQYIRQRERSSPS